jgi:hypothetical protein
VIRKWEYRQFIKIALQPALANGTDPYQHLHRFFEPAAVRQILSRPRHSVEQVEHIISLKADQADCDDQLRSMLYKLFGVATQSQAIGH